MQKQNVLSGGNRLDASFIGSGALSNAKFETLSDILTISQDNNIKQIVLRQM